MEKIKVVLPEPLPQNPENTTTPISSQPEINRADELAKAVKRNALSLPLRLQGKTMLNFNGHAEEAAQARKEILAGRGAFLTGLCGRGKTHLAVGMAYEWFVNGIKYGQDWLTSEPEKVFPKPPQFKGIVGLMLELQASFESPTSEMAILEKYAGATLLILDDLGTEKISEWSRSRFYWLLNERYLNCRPTIITSNLGLDEIAKLIDERIPSRVAEMGKAIKLEGKDYRLGLSETSR